MMRNASLTLRKRHVTWTLGALAAVAIAVIASFGLRGQKRAEPQSIHLPDGTEAFFLSDTRVEPAAGYPQPRNLNVDGDAFLRVPAGTTPLTVRTRLLILTVTGESAMRVTAFSKQTGEQVEVLYGQVEARKSYASPYSVPDVLTGGDMSMINRTIDLMEKEKFDTAQLRQWSEALVASARQHRTP